MKPTPLIFASSPAAAAVSCRKVTKAFQSGSGVVHALRDIDLDIHTGEICFLSGPSGCGKTTLLSVIAGLLTVDAGECALFGNSLMRMNDEDKANFRSQHIGVMFQSYHLLPTLSVAANVAIPLLLQEKSYESAYESALETLQEVGLADRAEEKPGALSGGQQQRVAIARAIIHRPQLLLCDEPTSALDHENGIKVMELLQSLNRKMGLTVVVVTHDNRIYHFAHRIAHMDDGCIKTIDAQVQALAVHS